MTGASRPSDAHHPRPVIARWRKRAKRSFADAHATPRSEATKGTCRRHATWRSLAASERAPARLREDVQS